VGDCGLCLSTLWLWLRLAVGVFSVMAGSEDLGGG